MTGRRLLVTLHGVEVGHLWSDGIHSLFSLHESYLDAPDRPVLGQYFEDRLLKKARRVRGMHPWFENVLPERFGALRRHFSEALCIDHDDSFSLLAALGTDLPGAVRVLADDGVPPTTEIIDEVGLTVSPQARFSLGGMQLKFSMSGEPSRLSLGMSDDAGDSWILKIGLPEYPGLAENEHAVMRWCSAAGFDVPETRVVEVSTLPNLGRLPKTPTAYLVRRFDRDRGNRIHQEDFAQVLSVSPSQKYKATDAAGLLRISMQVLGAQGAAEALRRLVVAVATGNCDAHLKNWSLVYPDRIQPAWSPLYDQVATIAFEGLERRLPMRIGSAQHLHEVSLEHIRWIALKAGIARERSDELTEETLSNLAASFAGVSTMSDHLVKKIRDLWRRVPLLMDHRLG